MASAATPVTFEMLKTKLQAKAARDNAQWSQYDGYWAGEGWKLVEVLQDVRTKFGMAFEKGEYAIARIDAVALQGFPKSVEVYSTHNKVNTILDSNKVKFL